MKSGDLKSIYKIHSARLRNSKWNMTLEYKDAQSKGEVINLSESQVLRFIDQILAAKYSDSHTPYCESRVRSIKKDINRLKNEETSKSNKKEIAEKYRELNDLVFVKDMIFLIIDSNKDFERANKGFLLNGLKFRRLYGTSGGVKKGVIVYVSERVYVDLSLKINNGRNPEKEIVPAKLEAYKALTSSGSIPIPSSNELFKFIVVKDYIHIIEENVTRIDNDLNIHSEMNYPVEYNINDGFGLISPEMSEKWAEHLGLNYTPAGWCIRFAFTKGMLFTFDFHKFAEVRTDVQGEEKYKLNDVWGNTQDIRGVDIVLSASMAKLWKSYDDLEDFTTKSYAYGYEFSITKVTPPKLENERTMNYQFLMSLNLDDDDIKQLVQPTIDQIKEVQGNDWRKSVLFLKGTHLTDQEANSLNYDFAQALMIEPESMINDPFVRQQIDKMIKKRIDLLKLGKFNIRSNFSIISGDPYAFAESMFGMTVKGLLGKGEYYSKYWRDKGAERVAAFRAPMTCHQNTRIFNLKDDQKVIKWYKHLGTITILNAWDTTTHAMNGADYDGDQVFLTDNPIILKSITPLNTIICDQEKVKPKIPTEEDLVKANKDSKGDDIGAITNHATAMYDLMASFRSFSKEYGELKNRIMKCQKLQQDSIDKAKGIEGKEMPKEWYSYRANMRENSEGFEKDEFNISILANKKPYFMIYRYEELMKEYKEYKKKANASCMQRFGLEIEDLQVKENRTYEESEFLKFYHIYLPITYGKSVVNKICWMTEGAFARKEWTKRNSFDYSILKSSLDYSSRNYRLIADLYEEYKNAVQVYEYTSVEPDSSEDSEGDYRSGFKKRFKQLALELVNNEDELCNIVLDICYRNNNSKQFAWDICGEKFIENLLKRSNGYINYPVEDPEGDIQFAGQTFSIKRVKIDKGVAKN